MRNTTILATVATLALGACGSYWNEEAGASLDQGEFGSATLNNQVEHTCRKMNAYNVGKYGNPIASNCPGRTQDGKYAMFAYRETIQSAAEDPSKNLQANQVVEN